MDTPQFEPEMPDLRHLLETGPAVPAGPETLRAIVARRNRGLIPTLVGLLAVALVAGPAVGYAVGNGNTTKGTSLHAGAAPAPTAKQPSPAVATNGDVKVGGPIGGGMFQGPDFSGPKPTQLFVRDTAEGIRVRAYQNEYPKLQPGIQPGIGSTCPKVTPVPAPPPNGPQPASGAPGGSAATGEQSVPPSFPCPAMPSCLPSGNLEAQVSNDQVAGQFVATAPTDSAGAVLQVLGAGVVGPGDPTPIATVIAHTGSGVDHIRLTVPGSGADEMAAKNGYAVLARGVAGLTPAKLATPPGTPVPMPAKGAPQGPGDPTQPGQGPVVSIVPYSEPVGFGFPAGSKVEAFDASGKVLATVDLPSWQPGSMSLCAGIAGGSGQGQVMPGSSSGATGSSGPVGAGSTTSATAGAAGAAAAPSKP